MRLVAMRRLREMVVWIQLLTLGGLPADLLAFVTIYVLVVFP
jgi:hypothetical protein